MSGDDDGDRPDPFSAFADRKLWLNWREEERNGKPTKVPYQPSSRRAASDDPATWNTRAVVRDAVPKVVNGHPGGIGIVLGEGLGGIDLDHCRDTDSSALTPWAEAVLGRIVTYGEISPSKTGLKLFFLYEPEDELAIRRALGADKAGNLKWGGNWKQPKRPHEAHAPGIEFYLGLRFFTVTGEHCTRTPRDIRTVSLPGLLWLVQEAGPALKGNAGSRKTANRETGRQRRGERRDSVDQSRSGAAWRIARAVRKHPAATMADLIAALRADPETAEWLREKGEAEGGRELHRLWDRSEPDARPRIEWRPDRLPQIRAAAIEALAAAPDLQVFQRGNVLVGIATAKLRDDSGKSIDVPRIAQLGEGALRDKLVAAASWWKFDGRVEDWVHTLPHPAALSAVIQAGTWPGIPDLRGLVAAPIIRPDGSIRAEPGFDADSGLLLATERLRLPPVPERPTREQARAALETLETPIRQMPFVKAEDRAVAVALLLTAVAYPTLPSAPLFAISATTPGTGKGKLVNCAAMLATGQHAAAYSFGGDAIEFEKLLGAILFAGDPIANIDNVSRSLVSDKLCQVLCEPVVGSRILGRSEAPKLPPRTLWTATGNNLTISGDLTRRVLVCALDAGVERPEQRRFAFDPPRLVGERRAELLTAALTILRSYIAAGRPAVTGAVFGSFEAWTRTVRDPLVWLGLSDPVATVEAARASDERLSSFLALAAAWKDTFGLHQSNTASEAIELAQSIDDKGNRRRPELFSAIEAVARSRGALDARRLGMFIAQHAGRLAGGMFFRKSLYSKGSLTWELKSKGSI